MVPLGSGQFSPETWMSPYCIHDKWTYVFIIIKIQYHCIQYHTVHVKWNVNQQFYPTFYEMPKH